MSRREVICFDRSPPEFPLGSAGGARIELGATAGWVRRTRRSSPLLLAERIIRRQNGPQPRTRDGCGKRGVCIPYLAERISLRRGDGS